MISTLSSILSIFAVIAFCYISMFSKTKREYLGLMLMGISVIFGVILKFKLFNETTWIASLLGLVGALIFTFNFVRRNTRENVHTLQYLSMIVLLLSFFMDTIFGSGVSI